MGYDMYLAHPLDRDRRGASNYFRLNIGGMSQARSELVPVCVMAHADQPHYPEIDDYGITYESIEDIEWSDVGQHWVTIDWRADNAETVVHPGGPALGFLDAVRHWRDDPAPGDTCGIPLYKVCSNDGWLVTPGEIKTSVAWADHHHPDWRAGLSDYVAEFVEWMELAATRGGFRVH